MHPSWTLPTLTYLEAAPGHHLDGATAMELEVPFVVKALWSNTSGEGWALYAERLAAEMGMYADDPYGDLGRLQAELHRAVRLVTDTGMHAKKWSREQAIEYMVDGVARGSGAGARRRLRYSRLQSTGSGRCVNAAAVYREHGTKLDCRFDRLAPGKGKAALLLSRPGLVVGFERLPARIVVKRVHRRME